MGRRGLEVVLLPGLMGSNLSERGGKRRIWISASSVFDPTLPRLITLEPREQEDGSTPRLWPDSPVRPFYGRMERLLTKAGYSVRSFPYDWRLSLTRSADALHAELARIQSKGARRIALVAHSMGGVLAATLAARHWTDFEAWVETTILLGSPIGGSLAVLEALTGKDSRMSNLSTLSHAPMSAFQSAAAGFPGLLQLMPRPGLLGAAPQGEQLYRAELWPTVGRPSQRHLDAARALTDSLWTSPMLARAWSIGCASYQTPSAWALGKDGVPMVSATGPGDGRVVTGSAWPAALPAARRLHVAKVPHMALARDSRVIEAVDDLLARGRTSALPVYNPALHDERTLAPDAQLTHEGTGEVDATILPFGYEGPPPDLTERETLLLLGGLDAEDRDER